MKSRLTISLIVVAGFTVLSQKPGPARSNGQQAHQQGQATITLINNGDSGRQQQRAQEKSPKWYAATEWPEWALVAVGLITFGGIWYQARATRIAADATRIAAEATRRTAQLQEIGLKQWVNLTDWECHLEKGDINRLNIFYKIVNPTKIPLDLDLICTTVDGRQTTTLGAVSWLVPDNPYIMDVTILPTDDQLVQFDASKLIVALNCSVFYRDSLGHQWEQSFRRLLTCSPGGVTFVLEARNEVRDSTPTSIGEETQAGGAHNATR